MPDSVIPENYHLDALAAEKALRRRLAAFAQSTAYLRDSHLSEICRRLWESDERNGGLVSQLWVEGIFPAENSGKTIRDLVAEGTVSAALLDQLDRNRSAGHYLDSGNRCGEDRSVPSADAERTFPRS